MRLLFISMLTLLTLSGCSTAKKTVKTPAKSAKTTAVKKEKLPEITFDNPVIDFGKVVKGESRTHDFAFRNSGDAPLLIEIATGCSCTTIDYPTQPILPGERGVIHIVFDSTHKKLGTVSVDIDVIANTKPLVTTATFNAEVIPKN